MSLFFNSYGNQEVDQEKIDVAGIQFDAMCSTFNNILSTCIEKCIPHDGYSEGELSKGEMCCIDRCVTKMHYTNRLIGGYVQSRGFGPETHLRHFEEILKKFPPPPSK